MELVIDQWAVDLVSVTYGRLQTVMLEGCLMMCHRLKEIPPSKDDIVARRTAWAQCMRQTAECLRNLLLSCIPPVSCIASYLSVCIQFRQACAGYTSAIISFSKMHGQTMGSSSPFPLIDTIYVI